MNILILPILIVLIIFLVFLHFSKKNEDIISIILYGILGILSMYWLAQIIYSDLGMPREWWKEAVILPGFMIVLIIWSALDDFSIMLKSFKES